jgi:hypothetical protein
MTAVRRPPASRATGTCTLWPQASEMMTSNLGGAVKARRVLFTACMVFVCVTIGVLPWYLCYHWCVTIGIVVAACWTCCFGDSLNFLLRRCSSEDLMLSSRQAGDVNLNKPQKLVKPRNWLCRGWLPRCDVITKHWFEHKSGMFCVPSACTLD